MPQAFVKTTSGWAPLQSGPAGPPGLFIYEQPSPPAAPLVGDVWIDTDEQPPPGYIPFKSYSAGTLNKSASSGDLAMIEMAYPPTVTYSNVYNEKTWMLARFDGIDWIPVGQSPVIAYTNALNVPAGTGWRRSIGAQQFLKVPYDGTYFIELNAILRPAAATEMSIGIARTKADVTPLPQYGPAGATAASQSVQMYTRALTSFVAATAELSQLYSTTASTTAAIDYIQMKVQVVKL